MTRTAWCTSTGDGSLTAGPTRRAPTRCLAESLHRFHTEEGWGGGWHRSHELRLLVDDGGAAPERMTWRDQRGNSGVVVLHTLEDEAEVTDVEASDEYAEAGEIAHNLLDDSRDKWLAGDDTALLDFTLARPATVTSYVLVSANDFPDRDPQDWTLHGSDDGHTWTPLDSRTGETFDRRYQAREFTVRGTPRAHRHLRLEITRNGGAHEIQLAQVRFLERPVGQGFTGYYQRHDEGPIGYRGTPSPPPPHRPPRGRFPRRLGPGDRRDKPRRDGPDPRRPGGTTAHALTRARAGVSGAGRSRPGPG